MEEAGPSYKEKPSNGAVHVDLDEEFDDDDIMDAPSVRDLDELSLKNFSKRASTSFFKHYGLISHQINSYNDSIKVGIQDVFDSMGEITIEPGYDPSKKGDNEWRYAALKFGKVTLERPRFWTGEKFSDNGGKNLEFLPRHARLQNMTYSSRMKVQMTKEVYTQELVRSDKFKTGKEKYLDKKVIDTEEQEVYIGRIPVMVNSDSCWMSGADKDDCDYDQGGYFIIKGAEKVEIKRDTKHKEVRIFCDAGRVLRPLLVVQNLHKIETLKGGGYSFQDLLDNGVVELIGPEEEEDCRTAWDIKYLFLESDGHDPTKYTHCELDMSFMLGLSCGIIPFANHDHAKRVLFQSQKHSQQAVGYSCTNPDSRVDKLSHQLFYPQRPLFRTMLSDCLEKPGQESLKRMIPRPEFYNGQCAIVAVNVHLGYNQEDSLVMNRASLDRGMFRSEHIRSYKAEVDNKEAAGKKIKSSDDAVNFGKIQSKIGQVDSLDDDGFPFIGANLQSGDIVIGKYTESGSDHSVKLKHTERGMVQKVVLSSNDEGKNFAVVSLRQVRSPCLGDKFSSMHGQKGVLGYLESHENFPFTLQGIVPDIVINPHAFPSRQTPGQMLESALGKGIALGGSQRYATPFSSLSIDAITDQLHRAGFSRWGNERLYDGRTGEIVKSLVFMGPTFYQRLVHMSEDKVKFRNTGPVHPLTRQPVADRKRFGGIKFGEMERDCLIAHGASATLYERLFTLSDCSNMHVCRKCKRMASIIQRSVPGGSKIRGPYCRVCESVEDVIKVNVPYGAKLLTQELFSMGISLKFDTELC